MMPLRLHILFLFGAFTALFWMSGCGEEAEEISSEWVMEETDSGAMPTFPTDSTPASLPTSEEDSSSATFNPEIPPAPTRANTREKPAQPETGSGKTAKVPPPEKSEPDISPSPEPVKQPEKQDIVHLATIRKYGERLVFLFDGELPELEGNRASFSFDAPANASFSYTDTQLRDLNCRFETSGTSWGYPVPEPVTHGTITGKELPEGKWKITVNLKIPFSDGERDAAGKIKTTYQNVAFTRQFVPQ